MRLSITSCYSLLAKAGFVRWSERNLLWLLAATLLLLVAALYYALFSPLDDALLGDEGVRLLFVHVPAMWVAFAGYGVMAIASAIYLLGKHPFADLIARQAVVPTIAFTLLALITIGLTHYMMRGVWWDWNGVSSMLLLLLCLCLGYAAITRVEVVDEPNRKGAATLSLLGVLNLLTVRLVLEWWPEAAMPFDPAIGYPPRALFVPSLLLFIALGAVFALCVLLRVQAALYQQKWRCEQLQLLLR